MKRPKVSKEALEECVAQNMSQYEIAAKFSICREYARNLCRFYGIPINNRRTKPPLSKELLIEEHHVNKLTLREISRKHDRTYVSIKHRYKKYGIEVQNNVIAKNNKTRQKWRD